MQSVLVSGVTLKDHTPIADVPLQIGGVPETSDENGEFGVMVPPGEPLEIRSALPAISFSPISGSGQQLSETYHHIEVRSLVEPKDVCRIGIGGVPHLYFSYVNELDESLVVPGDRSLNQFVPATDTQPETVFLSGEQGFARAAALFQSGSVWRLLGSSVTVEDTVPICSNRGDYLCQQVPQQKIQALELVARETVRQMADVGAKLLRRKDNASQVRFSPKFFGASARMIGRVREIMHSLPRDLWICEAVPSGCTERKFPKGALRAAVQKLCAERWPLELGRVQAACGRQARKLQVHLKTIPATYVDCSHESR